VNQNCIGMTLRNTRFLIPLSLVFVSIACAPKSGGDSEEKADAGGPVAVELAPVVQKTMNTVVTGSGSFVASQGSIAKVGAVSTGRVDKILVKEGDSVSAGQLVAILDNRVQGAQTQSAESALKAAQLQAAQSELNLRTAESDQAATLKIAKLSLNSAISERRANSLAAKYNLQAAQVALAKAKAGNRKQEISQAEQTVRQAQVTRDSASRDERRNSLLLEKGIVSKKAYEDAKAALTSADASLKTAQAQLSLMREGTRKEDLQAAELAVKAAQEALKSAQELGNQKVQQAEATFNQAEQGFLQVQAKHKEVEANKSLAAQKQADASAAQATQALTEVRSPIDGIVNRRLLNPGDTPDNNSPILEIVNLSKGLDFLASVTPSDATGIKAGQQVTVDVTGISGDIVGSVLSVGQVDATSGLAPVRIHISSSESGLRIGTFGTAHIVVASHKNALSIPKSAVLTRDDQPTVFVANGDKAKLVKPVTGIEEGDFIEVTKGLEKGQSVITVGNYELSDGGSIKTKEDEKKDGEKKDDDKKSDKKDTEKAEGGSAK